MSGLGLNNVNFLQIPALEGPITVQPIFLKNLRTATQPDTTYVVVALSLTHKSNFSILLPRKATSYQVKSSVLSSGVAVDQESDKDLLDPTVGFRFRRSLSDRFQISVRADIGGFDISDNTSKLSWQGIGLLGYELSKNKTLFAGYRAINLDYEKRGFELDLTFHGPVVGLAFLFGGSKAEAAE